MLNEIDLSRKISKKEYKTATDKLELKLGWLLRKARELNIPVIIVFEGWDAAGKGGNIRRLTETLDPRGYEVIPVSAPNDLEKLHNYLWRFWIKMPKADHISIFDRSWYGRVMVERVKTFAVNLNGNVLIRKSIRWKSNLPILAP